ncbi:MAG: ATP-binding protein [Porphyrobacter sp.]|nr:ATP-binding protein [Porphyrobacter sp.]
MNLADARPAGPRRFDAVRIVVWIVAVQILFWTLALLLRPQVIDPVFKQHEVTNIMVVSPDGQRKEATGRPNFYLGDGREARFVGSVTLDQPEHGLVLFVPRYNRQVTASVNGQAVPSSDAPAWRGSMLGRKWVVPAPLLRKGRNTITLEIRRPCCRAYLATLIAAPPGPIDIAIRQWRLQTLLPAFGLMVLGLFGGLACLFAGANSPHRSLTRAGALAFLGMALGGVWQIDILTPSSDAVYTAAGQLSLLTTFAGLVALADRWFPGGPRLDRVLVLLTIMFFVAIAAFGFTTDGMPPLARNLVEGLMVLTANIAIMACLVRGLKIEGRSLAPDAAAIMLVPTISLADLSNAIAVTPLAQNIAPLGVLALAVLLMLGFVRRARLLSRRLEDANFVLDARIAEKQAELEAAAHRLRKFETEAAIEGERRRIMRDLHDGLGSQLMTMMLTARLGEADPPKVAEGLQGVIDEMRLMVDSMDSVGESLEAALATFRARIQPRVEAAGFAFSWRQDAPLAPPDLGPRDVLQVFRIMQEAVTNALKHSGGSAIAVEVAANDGDGVAITIADNGKGGAASAEAGRGLANMKNRARALGADYALASANGEGTRVTLTLRQPVPAAHPM